MRPPGAGAAAEERRLVRPLSRYVLRKHIGPFVIALAALTSLVLVNQIAKRVATDGPGAGIPAIIVLSIPFILAMTLPMAVLFAVLRVFTSLPGDRAFAAMLPPGVTVMRIVAPVLGGAACVAALAVLWNDQVVPRSNHALRRAISTAEPADLVASDREMTIAGLRRAARHARAAADHGHARRAAMYEVEVHKKYAIATASLVFALVGAPFALRFARGGMALVIGLGFALSTMYYVALIAGEELGDRQTVTPFLAMWGANLALGLLGLVALLRFRGVACATLAVASGDVTSGGPDPAASGAGPGQGISPQPRLVELFVRPGVFFGGLARRVDARAVMAMWVVGASFAVAGLDRMLIVADLTPSRSASSSSGTIPAGPWLAFWLAVLGGGAGWAVLSWYVGGWWYGVRLRWAGVGQRPAVEARLLHTYSSLIVGLASLAYAIAATFLHDSYAEAWASRGSWSNLLLIFPFWSIVSSYRGLATWYRPANPAAARTWFIVLPCALYLAVFVAIRLAYRLVQIAPGGA